MAISCRDIVRRALRKLSRVAAGAQPDGDDLNDAIESLQSIYMELVGAGAFGALHDVVVTTATYAALPQQRILGARMGGVSITLPVTLTASQLSCIVGYGQGCWDYEFRSGYCGSGPWPPHDGACIAFNDEFSADAGTYIYNKVAARWQKISAIAPATIAPLGERYADTLASALAARIAPEYGMQTPPQVTHDALLGIYAMTHRYDSARGTQYDPARYF